MKYPGASLYLRLSELAGCPSSDLSHSSFPFSSQRSGLRPNSALSDDFHNHGSEEGMAIRILLLTFLKLEAYLSSKNSKLQNLSRTSWSSCSKSDIGS